MKTPMENAENFIAVGKSKTSLTISKMLVLGFMAGAFIAFASALGNTATATVSNGSISRLIAGCVFPAGLAMVVVAGSELFTGNSLIIISVLDRKVKLAAMLKNWLFVYIGNLVGSLFVAILVNVSHQLSLFGNALGGATINTAAAKTSLSFGDAFFKAILCNFLVCIAVWMCGAAKSAAGKIMCCFFPIMAFVVSGFEHSVANMYYISAGILAKGNDAYVAAASATANLDGLTWGAFFVDNLIPVTLGNIVGGLLVGAAYWFAYLRGRKEA